ncbi:chorismate synthase [Simkania negevensis]|uniref:Chorismate synthase n=1 Tax=Simkania negevensis TaxID=83561 RepID=A0ABS3AR71_9BACT|nr:chorismate synthase [Simkania negevensis]
MASNSFGKIFRFSTWGESHGPAIGAVIDGCPAGLPLNEEEINIALARRAPGKNAYTSARKEADRAQILSGLFDGVTTGAPITIMINNVDADPSKYEATKHLFKPGHANYTYLKKYGVFEYRGGGRASGRETACRVAVGAVAKKLLARQGITVCSYIKAIHTVEADIVNFNLDLLANIIHSSPIYCPDAKAAAKMMKEIERAKEAGDSLGGVVEAVAEGLPVGLGDPIYDKLEARLAYAMMGLPATKGFEVGKGFAMSTMRGSEANDLFYQEGGDVKTRTNHQGGVQGGISNGMPIVVRVAFKPPSSIAIPQKTIDIEGNEALFQQPKGSRHDPCIAIRAVPVVEAMLTITLADALLVNNTARIDR